MYLYDIHNHNLNIDATSISAVRKICNLSSPDELNQDLLQQKNIYFSYGIHPWMVNNHIDSCKLDVIDWSKFIAIGEVGLDKNSIYKPLINSQIYCFKKQVEIAIAYRKPIIIHCVKAWDELIKVYKYFNNSEISWIIHGFRGKNELALQLSKLGFYFSIGERYNSEAVRIIPRTSLFCETDDSSLPIKEVYLNLTQTLNLDFDNLVEIIESNVEHTFFS